MFYRPHKPARIIKSVKHLKVIILIDVTSIIWAQGEQKMVDPAAGESILFTLRQATELFFRGSALLSLSVV
jgi:hypothetical protein